jgi:hypothetical protein
MFEVIVKELKTKIKQKIKENSEKMQEILKLKLFLSCSGDSR